MSSEDKTTKDGKKDADEGGGDQSPWDQASLLARYSLSFVLPLIKLAWRNELHLEHLPQTPSGDLSRTLGERLERNYLRECARVNSHDDGSQPAPERATQQQEGPLGVTHITTTTTTTTSPVTGQPNMNKKLAELSGGGGGLESDERISAKKSSKKRPSLTRALFQTFGLELVLANLFNTFVRMILFPLQTVALGWLLADLRRYSNLRAITDVFVDPERDSLLGHNLTHEVASVFLNHIHDYNTQQYSNGNQAALWSTLDDNNDTLAQQTVQAAAAATVDEQREQIYLRLMSQLFILVSCTCLASCLLHPFYFKTYHLGMKCRVAACHLIYKKALRLSQRALGEATAGQMINLLSNDVNRFDRVAESVPFLWDGPIQVALISFILSKYYLGLWPTLAGLLVILGFMFLQGVSGKLFSRFRSRAAAKTDERVRLMSEIIQAIKVIKMYAWERAFWFQVVEARKREISELRNSFMIRVINQTLFFMSSKIIVFAMLMVYILLDYGSLDPELIFVTIGLSNLIRVTISMYLANSIAQCAETLISCQRINDFLQLPEISADEGGSTSCQNKLEPNAPMRLHSTQLKFSTQGAIRFERAYAWWGSRERMVLRNLSLTIEANQLVLLVGRVGSGKSSVLLSLLGELPLAGGQLEINGRLSYAPQEAWLFAGSVRDNILFGEPFEPARYQEVVRVCCLERDFAAQFQHGDQTLVGERGAALSGGQRARVNLARALYRQADIYLLDDPLSAVDAPVARHIISECLARPGGFLADRTVLLATHQLQALRQAERVLLLDQQAPAMFGTPSEILNSTKFKLIDYGRQAFEDAVGVEPPKSGSSADSGSELEVDIEAPLAQDEHDEKSDKRVSLLLTTETTTKPTLKGANHEEESQDDRRQLDNKELHCGVASDASTYLYYWRHSFRSLVFVWFLLILVVAQAIYLWIDFMLSRWTDAREQLETLGSEIYKPQNFIDRWNLTQMTRYYAISIACGLGAVFLVCLTYALASIRASKRIHQSLLMRLLHGQMSYFESTSIGILLNRVSRDLGFVDQILPLSAMDIVMIFSNILAIILLTIIINPYNSLLAIGLLSIALSLRSLSLCAITRLKQLEGITRSPVFSHLSTSLNGLATIRAFQVETTFNQRFDRLQDVHSSAWFAFVCTTRWLGQAMDWTSITFVSVVLIGAIVFQLDAVPASLIGLLSSHAVYMPGAFQAAMRQLVEAESQMTSVQRLKEICELEVERDQPAAHEDGGGGGGGGGDGGHQQPLGSRETTASGAADADKRRGQQLSATLNAMQARKGGAGQFAKRAAETAIRPDAVCPVGCIKFVDVTLRYESSSSSGNSNRTNNKPNLDRGTPRAEPKAVLKRLNLLIRPRERIGIVGRTGAGKSSLIGVLFRLYHFEGRIEIDGRDSRSLSLSELRNSMSIIPQDPVLFAGTLRQNLDPFQRHSDAELWRALEAVQMGSQLFAKQPLGLDFHVGENGSNFSVGQRQLICLARAIVRQNKILVLDEATASVDPETDQFIQTTIKQQFAQCTVLTIAHRLVTIVDSDRVLVLDCGQVGEFGEPHELVQKRDGLFSQMVASSGPAAPRLLRLIEEAHERRNSAS